MDVETTNTRIREMSYAEAILDAHRIAMELDSNVYVNGIGVDGPAGVFGTTNGLVDTFGPKRVFDTPIAELALTAMAAGAANAGLRPVLVHQRFDFMMYAVDPIVNWMGLWHYISGGQAIMPVTIRAIVGKGWGQGPQHSKSLHSWFAHVPGIQVVMPSSPFDAKGLLLSSIFSNDPTIFIEGRSLFSMKEAVPEEPYFIELGKAAVRRKGADISLVAIGSMIPNALEAADELSRKGCSVEVIDLRTIAPLDMDTVLRSLKKTGRLVVADPGWQLFGASGEIIAGASEAMATDLKAAPVRVTWPHSYVPTSGGIEPNYYPGTAEIVSACQNLVVS